MKSDPANFLVLATILLVVYFGRIPAWAQTSDSPSSDPKSWASTSESRQSGMNPTRTSETHTEGDGRTVDKQAVERIGPDGRYEPYLETEKESVKVDATTVRIVERTFGRDSEGQKILIQVTEEERRSLTGGDAKSVRTTSNPDANGRLQIVQQEIQETKKTGPNVEDTKTTVLTAMGVGGWVKSAKA